MGDSPAGPSGFTVNDNSAVYYGNDYWNDLPEVVAWLNEKVSGDPDRYWAQHFAATIGRPFKRALILNCGNGNVEQGLIANHVVDEAVGIDYSDELLDEARRAAAELDLRARYEQLDTNTARFPDDEFDLVVNHAAAHHIAFIDRVFRELSRRLGPDGCFCSYDYVGPHRNQYPWETWDAAETLNRSLPERFRQDMAYPHLPTMLDHDPTEAIHSELIVATMQRYFHIDELRPLGGALAYPLLTHNRRMFDAAPDDPERLAAIETILAADTAFTEAHPEHSLFAYIVARPDPAAFDDAGQLDRWTREEDDREAAAHANGGEYYPRTTLQELVLDREQSRVDALHAAARADDLQQKNTDLQAGYEMLQARVAELQAQCDSLQAHYDDLQARYDRIMSLPPYQQIRWLARTDAGQRLRHDERVARAIGKLRGGH